jgi:hypothetical protein
MIAVLHFDSVVDRLLRNTRGNIYLPNELNRIGELSETRQIRLASQSLTLDDVPDLDTPVAALSYPEIHAMGLPLTGAIFDALVEVFQEILAQEGFISRELDDVSRQVDAAPADEVQAGFDRAYAGRHDEFKAALLDARDYMGRCLSHTWRGLRWDLTFGGVAAATLSADSVLTGGVGRRILLDSLLWRGIQVPFRSAGRSYSDRMAAARMKQA